MKKLIATIAIAGLSLGLATSVFAQAAGPKNQGTLGAGQKQKGAGQNARKAQKEMLAKLNLTDEQKTKLKAHQEKMQAKMKDLRAEMEKDPTKKEGLREKMQAFRKEQQEGLKAILTAEQQKKFETFMKEMHAKRQGQRKGGGKKGGAG
jgi:periplasmic protein CpxP/Spy